MSATLVGMSLYPVYSPGAVDSLCHLWPDSCSQYKETLTGTLFLNKHLASGRHRSIKMLIGPEKQYFSSWFLWRRRGREGCKQIRWLSKYTLFTDFGGPTESTKANKAPGLGSAGFSSPHTCPETISASVEKTMFLQTFCFNFLIQASLGSIPATGSQGARCCTQSFSDQPPWESKENALGAGGLWVC